MNYVFSGNRAYIENYLPNLLRSIQKYNRGCEFFIISNEEFSLPGFKYIKLIDTDPIVKKYNRFDDPTHYINESTFLKFSIFKLLPKDLYLYSDIDCICLGDLDFMFEKAREFGLAAPRTIWGYKLQDGVWVERTSHNERWNAGFFCIDTSNKMFDSIYEKAEKYLSELDSFKDLNGDMTVFNDLIKDFYPLDQTWNWCISYVQDIINVVPEQAWRYLEICQLNKLKSIHYSGKDKPWNSKCMFYEIWRSYSESNICRNSIYRSQW